MMNDLWLALRLWQGLGAQSALRPQILDLLLDLPIRSWEALRMSAEARGIPLKDPFRGTDEAVVLEARREEERMLRKGWRLVVPGDPLYPRKLLKGMDPPLTLSFAGPPEILDRPALAIVGSREPQRDSLLWMERELANFCRQSKAVIVSGGARGIDQKAHSVALRNSCPTVAFLPSGLEQVYPSDFAPWIPAILDGGGAVVSEYPGSQRMGKQNFHQRNRLIAACGEATLIVEAKVRSGTLITATRAAEIGRALWVVPGHPNDVSHAGNLQLLAEGATMVRQNEDLTLFWEVEIQEFSSRVLPLGDRCTIGLQI